MNSFCDLLFSLNSSCGPNSLSSDIVQAMCETDIKEHRNVILICLYYFIMNGLLSAATV